MKKMIDSGIKYIIRVLTGYNPQARFLPLTFALLPLIVQVTCIFVVKDGHLLSSSARGINNVSFVLGAIATIAVVLTFLLIPISQALSRHFIESLYFFGSKVSMPTTSLLMEADRTLSSQKIKEAVREEFDIAFLSQKEARRTEPYHC